MVSPNPLSSNVVRKIERKLATGFVPKRATPGGGRVKRLRFVFESSVHAKRIRARLPTSRPAGGVVRGAYPERGAVDGGLRVQGAERAGLPAVGGRAWKVFTP